MREALRYATRALELMTWIKAPDLEHNKEDGLEGHVLERGDVLSVQGE